MSKFASCREGSICKHFHIVQESDHPYGQLHQLLTKANQNNFLISAAKKKANHFHLRAVVQGDPPTATQQEAATPIGTQLNQ